MIETLIRPERETFPSRKRITRTMCQSLVNNGLLDERYELIDGWVILKAPGKPPHRIASTLVRNLLFTIFGSLYVQYKSGLALPGPEGETTEPQPDIAVTLAPTTEYFDSNPGPQDVRLVVEVSNTTLDFDLDTKALLYARVEIPEYWVMDVNGRQIYRHREPSQEGYREIVILRETENVSPLNRTEIVRVGDLFPAPRPAAD